MRTNHRDLHRKLESLGYIVYTCDYSIGTHHYQIEKGTGSTTDKNYEWHEYTVNTKNKIIDAFGCDGDILKEVKEHYSKQGYSIISK